MIITRETKVRFVEMLNNRQIIVVMCNKNPRSRNYNIKVIGANDDGKWDFTPLVAEFSGWEVKNTDIMFLSIFSDDAVAVIADTLETLRKQGIPGINTSGYALYQEVKSIICTFYV